jgi:shikimate dehydrogenase
MNKKILEFREGEPSTLFRFLQFIVTQKPEIFQLEQQEKYGQEFLKGVDAALFSFEQSRLLYPSLQVLPTQVRLLECFDFYLPEDGKWYPRLLFYEAIHKVLVARARDMDIRVPAFVVGEGECLRVAAAVCAELGYAEIYLIGENSAQLHRESRILSRGNLGIKFKVLPIEELTLQAVSASLIINTVSLPHDSDFLKDLSYFNFMNTGGYAFDCHLGNLRSELMEEAERADLKVLYPTELLQALVEIVFEKLKQSHLVTATDISEWVKAFKEQNSPSV